MTPPVRIAGLATATPPHELPQSQVRQFAHGLFADDFPQLDRLLRVFDNAGIASRQLARELAWFRQPHSFPEKNEVWRDASLQLSCDAARRALADADLAPADIGALVFVSSTGIATPSLDGALVQRLDLPRDVARTPVWGLGCAGGAAGLSRAAALGRGLQTPVLLIAAEICSATFVHEDRSKSNLVATALFGDGAAAAVLVPEPGGLQILADHRRLIDDSEDVMGWDLRPAGLAVRFARSIPSIVTEVVVDFVAETTRKVGATRADVDWWALHPGGAKVLDAYARALQLTDADLAPARDVLRDHGNMSSPTALFVLHRLRQAGLAPGSTGLLVGLGPGFCAESVLLRQEAP